MVDTRDSHGNYFAYLISYAKNVLGCSLDNIKDMFSSSQIYLFNYSQKTAEQLMEIRVDRATLTCFLSPEGTCKSSYLFLDNNQEIDQYIAYCNKTYPLESNAWQIDNCSLTVDNKRGDSVFQFVKS